MDGRSGKSPPTTDETSSEEVAERRSRSYSMSSGRRLPTPPGSDSAQKNKQQQAQMHPKVSDTNGTVPQRTHGELSSQDSLFSRLFSRRDSKILGAEKDVSAPGKEALIQSNSVALESASAPTNAAPARPSSLGPLQREPSGETGETRVMSPLTEQVTSQNNKLTQMLNLFRPDVKPQEQSSVKDPRMPKRSLSMPEEEFLHKKATLPLESPKKPQPEVELHPLSPQRLFRQKPTDGQDAVRFLKNYHLVFLSWADWIGSV